MAYVVTVTGASGYIGTELTKQLLEKGYVVRATVRDKSVAAKVFPPFLPPRQLACCSMPSTTAHFRAHWIAFRLRHQYCTHCVIWQSAGRLQ